MPPQPEHDKVAACGTPRTRLPRLYLVVVYWISWGLFLGVGALFSTFICLPLLAFKKHPPVGKACRRTIAFLMKIWLLWLRLTGVARIDCQGFDSAPRHGTIYIANHPSLLDATFLLAHLPHSICIVKPQLLRNPATGPAVALAGYFSASEGIDLLKGVVHKLEEGCGLLIFPEGSRTEAGNVLNPLRPGFARIAERAKAPVQSILIHTSRGLARRGGAWWRPPSELPARVELTLARRWPHSAERSPAQLVLEVETYLRTQLNPATAGAGPG
jgi:1-acyl-sn-glycerol-3-phosphate acyltransferase